MMQAVKIYVYFVKSRRQVMDVMGNLRDKKLQV